MSFETDFPPTTGSSGLVEILPLTEPASASESAAVTSSPIPASSAQQQQQLNTASQSGATSANNEPTTELARSKHTIRAATRRFMDFPITGIDFVDIMPLFASPSVHALLLDALTQQIASAFGTVDIDVVVGLDARGFLFGPGLALRLGVAFAPVRKKGKLPGPCVTAAYEKEYGTDLFQMQADGVRKEQKVLVVDDIIATGEFWYHAWSWIRVMDGNANDEYQVARQKRQQSW